MKKAINGLDLWVERGGSGAPTLLLCHGAGGTGNVWAGLVEILARQWPGGWIIPDLRGHGRSDHAGNYSVGHHAADMASLVRDAGPVVICGHSMGGLVAIALATGWYGVDVTHVIAIGTRTGFSDQERDQAIERSKTPTRWFETRAQAVERFLLVSGLTGLVSPESDIAASGIVGEGGRFRLAADMRTAEVAKSAFTVEIHAAARSRAKVVLAAGTADQVATVAQLRTLDPLAVELTGLGHNAHVENPEAVWKLIADAVETVDDDGVRREPGHPKET
jgi:pimeloyl-ACP methyl ester carboxylesterase